MKRLSVVLCPVVAAFGALGHADAELFDRGGGLVYDSDQDITWLQTAHQDFRLNWEDALSWADDLAYYDSVRDITWNDWRMPYTPGTSD